MTNFNYDNYDDDTKAKYDDGIEFLDDDFSFDEDDDDEKLFEEKSHNGIKIFFLIFGLLVLGAALYFIITRYVL